MAHFHLLRAQAPQGSSFARQFIRLRYNKPNNQARDWAFLQVLSQVCFPLLNDDRNRDRRRDRGGDDDKHERHIVSQIESMRVCPRLQEWRQARTNCFAVVSENKLVFSWRS